MVAERESGGMRAGGGIVGVRVRAGETVTVTSLRKPDRSRSLVGISQGDRARRVAFGDLQADDQASASGPFLNNPRGLFPQRRVCMLD